MQIGRRPEAGATYLDDVDRAYVVSQLEGALDEVVELEVAARRGSPLLVTGGGTDEGRRAEQLGTEIAALVPKVRLSVVDGAEPPAFKVSARGAGSIRFVGLPRVNLVRALLDAIRRLSNHDHGFEPAWARDLRQLPADVHAAVFATPI